MTKTFYITYYANKHKKHITRRGKHDEKSRFGVSKKGIAYFKPLISGKLEHKFSSMPKYKKGKLKLVKKKLPLWV